MRLFFSCLVILGINMLVVWTASAAPSGITSQKIDIKTIEVAYLFEEGKGQTAQDISSNKRHGTLEGGVKYGPGKFGTGLVYDGKDDNLIVKGYRGLGGKQARTVLYWFKSASAREHSWVI